MRIRKHAKISTLIYATSSLQHDAVLQTTVCLLNQSPWDLLTFSPHAPIPPSPPPPPPPPPLYHQVEEEDSSLGNGSFGDSIGAVESVPSMKLSFDDEKETKEYENTPKYTYPDDDVAAEEERFCSKIDSKGWQCHRVAESGHTFCEHHLSRVKKYNNGSKSLVATEHRRRGRPEKGSASTAPASGYYYYSGFGPRWGKRRAHNNNNIDGDNGNSGDVEGGELLPSETIGYGELDYMAEEEEEDGGGGGGGGSGKKRGRKLVKARSLKSLM